MEYICRYVHNCFWTDWQDTQPSFTQEGTSFGLTDSMIWPCWLINISVCVCVHACSRAEVFIAQMTHLADARIQSSLTESGLWTLCYGSRVGRCHIWSYMTYPNHNVTPFWANRWLTDCWLCVGFRLCSSFKVTHWKEELKGQVSS